MLATYLGDFINSHHLPCIYPQLTHFSAFMSASLHSGQINSFCFLPSWDPTTLAAIEAALQETKISIVFKKIQCFLPSTNIPSVATWSQCCHWDHCRSQNLGGKPTPQKQGLGLKGNDNKLQHKSPLFPKQCRKFNFWHILLCGNLPAYYWKPYHKLFKYN